MAENATWQSQGFFKTNVFFSCWFSFFVGSYINLFIFQKPELWKPKNPENVPQCVDPRGCPLPPLRNERIWGSYEDKDKGLEGLCTLLLLLELRLD